MSMRVDGLLSMLVLVVTLTLSATVLVAAITGDSTLLKEIVDEVLKPLVRASSGR